jgi:hypothetical protein
VSLDRQFLDFRVQWGITDIITSAQMREWFSIHRYGMQDLDDTNQIRDIITQASVDYKSLAHDANVQKLSKIKYRNGLEKPSIIWPMNWLNAKDGNGDRRHGKESKSTKTKISRIYGRLGTA